MTPHDEVQVDESHAPQLVVTGGDRVRFLQGMLTNDVGTLDDAGCLRAAILNVKGRVLALVTARREGETIRLVTEPGQGEALRALLDRYAIADDVAFAAEARPLHRVWASSEDVWSAPLRDGAAPAPSAPAAVELARIEAGLPRFGVDVCEDHFPFEANLERALSRTKGCYVGQEVVARAHARGGANKALVGLRVDGAGAIAIEVGARVSTPEREDAGAVTSAASSPRLGAIALGYVHKSAWEPGHRVTVGGREAVVCALPFPPGA